MCTLSFIRTNMAVVQSLVLFTIFGCSIVYADSPFKPCNPDDPIYKNIEVMTAQCNSTPCLFRRGSDVNMTASFIPEEYHRKLYIVMYFDLNGVRVNYEGEHHASVCNSLYSYPDKVWVGCPVEKGKRYIFERKLHVLSNVPKLPRVVVHWAVRDSDTKKDVVCYDIVVKIV